LFGKRSPQQVREQSLTAMYNKLNPNAVGLHNHSTGEKILTLLNKNKFGYVKYVFYICIVIKHTYYEPF